MRTLGQGEMRPENRSVFSGERPDKDVGAGVHSQNQVSSWVRCARKTNWFSAVNDPTRTSGLELVDRTQSRHGRQALCRQSGTIRRQHGNKHKTVSSAQRFYCCRDSPKLPKFCLAQGETRPENRSVFSGERLDKDVGAGAH